MIAMYSPHFGSSNDTRNGSGRLNGAIGGNDAENNNSSKDECKNESPKVKQEESEKKNGDETSESIENAYPTPLARPQNEARNGRHVGRMTGMPPMPHLSQLPVGHVPPLPPHMAHVGHMGPISPIHPMSQMHPMQQMPQMTQVGHVPPMPYYPYYHFPFHLTYPHGQGVPMMTPVHPQFDTHGNSIDNRGSGNGNGNGNGDSGRNEERKNDIKAPMTSAMSPLQMLPPSFMIPHGDGMNGNGNFNGSDPPPLVLDANVSVGELNRNNNTRHGSRNGREIRDDSEDLDTPKSIDETDDDFYKHDAIGKKDKKKKGNENNDEENSVTTPMTLRKHKTKSKSKKNKNKTKKEKNKKKCKRKGKTSGKKRKVEVGIEIDNSQLDALNEPPKKKQKVSGKIKFESGELPPSLTGFRLNDNSNSNGNGNEIGEIGLINGNDMNDMNDENGNHPCPHCLKNFSQRCHLLRHVREQHLKEGRAYKCDFCDKSFLQKSNLDTHVMTHASDPSVSHPFLCFICNSNGHAKKFTRKSSLKRHCQTKHPNVDVNNENWIHFQRTPKWDAERSVFITCLPTKHSKNKFKKKNKDKNSNSNGSETETEDTEMTQMESDDDDDNASNARSRSPSQSNSVNMDNDDDDDDGDDGNENDNENGNETENENERKHSNKSKQKNKKKKKSKSSKKNKGKKSKKKKDKKKKKKDKNEYQDFSNFVQKAEPMYDIPQGIESRQENDRNISRNDWSFAMPQIRIPKHFSDNSNDDINRNNGMKQNKIGGSMNGNINGVNSPSAVSPAYSVHSGDLTPVYTTTTTTTTTTTSFVPHMSM